MCILVLARRTALALGSLVALCARPALASSVCGETQSDFLNIGQYVCGFNSLLTGPIAELISILAILAGAWLFFESGELHRGMKHLGVLVIAIGVIMALPVIMGKISGATI
jgi:type IV secretory pathway VirB2 component (pilin)